MKHFEYSLLGGDRHALYGQGWESEVPPRGVVCLVHGLGEHSGRYHHVAERMSHAGYHMISFDQRGHGKTLGKRGVTPRFEILMDDISALQQEASRRFPGMPVFLYGHSMGGCEVVNYALRCKPAVTGLIVTSPGFATAAPVTGVRYLAAKTFSKIWPSFTLPNGLDRDGLSRDPNVVTAYQDDPLVHDQVSARLGWDILTQGQWAIEHAGELACPLLLMAGTQDRIISVDAIRRFEAAVKTASPELITSKYWDGYYHEVHNEPEKAQVIDTMIDWASLHIKEKLRPGAPIFVP